MEPVPSTRVALATAALLLLAGCGGSGDGSDGGDGTGPFTTTSRGPAPVVATSGAGDRADAPEVVGTIATGLEVPWGVAFLPDGSALVTERDSGRVLHLVRRDAGWRATEVGRLDETVARGESGLLGVAVGPSYDEDHAVFLYLSTDTDNRIVRATFDGTRLGTPEPVLTGIPLGTIHDGGRLAFGPDGFLYASTGETGQGDLAQDPGSLAGKVLRITTAGKPAPGNPDPSSPVWTIGHRNVQGLAFDAQGRLWASEFGASEHDELNLVRRGQNYGWPEVEGASGQDRYRNPQVVWSTDEASPSGLAYLDGHLWLGALHGSRLWRVDLHGARASAPADFFVGRFGRLRSVVAAPDGTLWVTTSNRDGRGDAKPGDDRILQVRP